MWAHLLGFLLFFPLPTQPSPGSQILPKRGKKIIKKIKKIKFKKIK
jgi:hypothetical protein